MSIDPTYNPFETTPELQALADAFNRDPVDGRSVAYVSTRTSRVCFLDAARTEEERSAIAGYVFPEKSTNTENDRVSRENLATAVNGWIDNGKLPEGAVAVPCGLS